MRPLPPFWYAAARLTGRLDLSGVIHAGCADPSDLPGPSLAGHGVRLEHAAQLAVARQPGPAARYLTLADPDYPEALRRLPHAPPVLFVQGNTDLLAGPGVAIVGSRQSTGDGERMARMLARAVKHAGGVVVSGLAQGIDSAAHSAALSHTIAVLGQGLQRSLPRHRERLREDIVESGGLILSEQLPLTPAGRHTYPMRNRIIAGVARATVVVEARARSGARITARCALDAGREVLAVPSSPLRETAAGCLALLREGATMVTAADDLLTAAGLPLPSDDPVDGPLDPLLASLHDAPAFDVLLHRTGLSAPALLRSLARLELAGQVERLPGDRFARRTG
jgi:DNA processing protein